MTMYSNVKDWERKERGWLHKSVMRTQRWYTYILQISHTHVYFPGLSQMNNPKLITIGSQTKGILAKDAFPNIIFYLRDLS